jgi:hypothetical protein
MNTLQLAKLKQFLLQEIGDSTQGYTPKLDYERDGHYEYSFQDSNDIEYAVDVWLGKDGYLVVDFNVPYGYSPTDDNDEDNESEDEYEDNESEYAVTNLGQQYRIMGTVVKIIKNLIDQSKPGSIKGIKYHPTYKSKDTFAKGKVGASAKNPINQRDRLYRAYIQRAFPDNEIRFSYGNEGSIISHFPQ